MKLLAALALALTATVPAAMAADLPIAPPPVYVETANDWSGFYAGVKVGVVSTQDNFDHDGDDFFVCGLFCDGIDELNLTGGGGLFGAELGYDAQFDSFVVGGYVSLSGTRVISQIDAGDDTAESTLDWVGSAQVRGGYAMDNWLFYGHGGVAFAKTEQTYTAGGEDFDFYDDDNDIQVGWVAGIGLEYMLTDNVSLKTEYSFYDLGRNEIGGDDADGGYEDLSFHALTAGVNFRF